MEDWEKCFTEALPLFKGCHKGAFFWEMYLCFVLFQRDTVNICKFIIGPVLTDCGS